MPEGLNKGWHENGQLSFEENAKDGSGTLKLWHKNGQLKRSSEQKNNKLIIVEAWDENGIKIDHPLSIHEAAEIHYIEGIKQHLADGADINEKDKDGNTPLFDAAYYGHKEIVELLIASGADVNAKDDDGETTLDFAYKPEITELLRKHGGKTGEELKAEGK